jgi:hypothetical protein
MRRRRTTVTRKFGWQLRSASAFTSRPARRGTGAQGASRIGAGVSDGDSAGAGGVGRAFAAAD